jgi:hypothetical protein
VVALFDNDTAAKSALRGIDRVNLPSSLKILCYPEIDIARNYPTTGPSGLVQMDVNGLAGSLELYFGEDVLRRADQTLTPVRWRGMDEFLRAYQGEIEDKAKLHVKFFKKLNSAAADSKELDRQDWSGIRAILDMARHAFQNDPLT